MLAPILIPTLTVPVVALVEAAVAAIVAVEAAVAAMMSSRARPK